MAGLSYGFVNFTGVSHLLLLALFLSLLQNSAGATPTAVARCLAVWLARAYPQQLSLARAKTAHKR
jgi:hypothetical protein